MQAWEAHDPTLTRPIAAPLERCVEFLGVDLAAVRDAAAHVEPYIRVEALGDLRDVLPGETFVEVPKALLRFAEGDR